MLHGCCCDIDRLLPSERVRTLGKSRVRIADVRASDNGVYSCAARNVAGSVDSRDNFILNVHGTNDVTASFYRHIYQH